MNASARKEAKGASMTADTGVCARGHGHNETPRACGRVVCVGRTNDGQRHEDHNDGCDGVEGDLVRPCQVRAAVTQQDQRNSRQAIEAVGTKAKVVYTGGWVQDWSGSCEVVVVLPAVTHRL